MSRANPASAESSRGVAHRAAASSATAPPRAAASSRARARRAVPREKPGKDAAMPFYTTRSPDTVQHGAPSRTSDARGLTRDSPVLVPLATSFPLESAGFSNDALRDGLNTGELWSSDAEGTDESTGIESRPARSDRTQEAAQCFSPARRSRPRGRGRRRPRL